MTRRGVRALTTYEKARKSSKPSQHSSAPERKKIGGTTLQGPHVMYSRVRESVETTTGVDDPKMLKLS